MDVLRNHDEMFILVYGCMRVINCIVSKYFVDYFSYTYIAHLYVIALTVLNAVSSQLIIFPNRRVDKGQPHL